MSSIIKQIEQSEYEYEWFEFLNFNYINGTDNEISSNYSKEFQSFIIKKAKHYIKQNFSSWKRFQVSTTYSSCISNINRGLFKKDVIFLVNQFFTWKKKKDEEIRKEANELIVNTATKIHLEKEELKSIQDRLNVLRR